MRHNLMPIIRKKPSHLILHAEMNEVTRFTSREILDQLLNFKKIVSEPVPNGQVIISTLTVRSDDGKAGLSIILPAIFEKHKICLNRTKSLLTAN